MKKYCLFASTILLLTCFFYPATKVSAADLITNGSFETGTFTGWTVTNPASGYRNWTISATGFGGDDGSGFTPVPTQTIVQHGSRSAWNGVTAGAGQSYLLYQQVTIPAAGSATVQWIDRYQMNYTQFCSSSCGTAQYFVEITNTAGTVLQTLYTVTTVTNSNSNTGYVTHYANLGTAYAGQTIRIRFRTLVQNSLQGPGQLEIDNVRLNSPGVLNPTAANVPVSGRVLSAEGGGIRNIMVSLTDSQGASRTAQSNSFGYYHFDDVAVGQTYTIAVGSKRYTFPQPSHILTVVDEIADLDFIANAN